MPAKSEFLIKPDSVTEAREYCLPEPNPDLRASIIIPIRAEYKSGQFIGLLVDLFRQRRVTKAQFEAIFVVNEPDAKHNKYNPDKKRESDAVWQIIRWLNHEQVDLPKSLLPSEVMMLMQMREAGFVVGGIYQTFAQQVTYQPSMNPSAVDPIEASRALGMQERINALSEDQKRKVFIISFDADSYIGPRFLDTIFNHLDQAPKIKLLRLRYETTPGPQYKQIYQNWPRHRITRAITTLNFLRLGGNNNDFFAIRADAFPYDALAYETINASHRDKMAIVRSSWSPLAGRYESILDDQAMAQLDLSGQLINVNRAMADGGGFSAGLHNLIDRGIISLKPPNPDHPRTVLLRDFRKPISFEEYGAELVETITTTIKLEAPPSLKSMAKNSARHSSSRRIAFYYYAGQS